MGPSGPSLPLGKSASTKHLVPFPWSISGARHRESQHQALKPKQKPIPLERKGTVVEQGQEPKSVPPRPGILLLQMISAQESGMESEISRDSNGQTSRAVAILPSPENTFSCPGTIYFKSHLMLSVYTKSSSLALSSGI